MKTVLAIVILVVASTINAAPLEPEAAVQYAWEVENSESTSTDYSSDQEALDEFLFFESDTCEHLIPRLIVLIKQYRDGTITKKTFCESVRALLYDVVNDQRNVDDLIDKIVSYVPPKKTGSRVTSIAKIQPSNAGGVWSTRTKGDTYVGSGFVGGDGGDSSNSVHSGIYQSGGGSNGIISSVLGTNNQGVYQGRPKK